MNYKRYNNLTGVSPAALGCGACDRDFPMLFFRMQPEIDRECDDLDRRGVRRLSPAIVNDSVNRMSNNIRGRYPDLAAYADNYERNSAYTSYNFHSLGVDVQIFGLFAGLVTLLFLSEFFRRRRIRRFVRRHF